MPHDDAPSLGAILNAFTGFQRTAAIRTGVDLDLFTAIGEGADTATTLAARCQASPRGVRSLCDRLVVDGLLTKTDGRWGLTPTAEAFLDRRSPMCIASAVTFMASPTVRACFEPLTEVVRRGGTVLDGEGTMEPDHPVWVEFARGMAPLARMQAMLLQTVAAPPYGRILDVAAGHGLFGVTLATQDPEATVAALDWASVLRVAEENAAAAGVRDRWRALPGSAFDTEPGGPYDTILVTHFMHHFDPETCVRLLRRLRGALAPGGRCVTLEFVPDDDRVSPPEAATFSLVMLATTTAGDAYTFAEYEPMFREAGFAESVLHDLGPTPVRAIVSRA